MVYTRENRSTVEELIRDARAKAVEKHGEDASDPSVAIYLSRALKNLGIVKRGPSITDCEFIQKWIEEGSL